MSLSVSNLVRVTVNLSPVAASPRSFGVLMVAGDSDIISGLERFRTYLTLEAVAADFGLEAPEYGAAALYFGQTPKPKTIMIGRWLRTATGAQNIGGVLSSSEQAISSWTSISDGGFIITVDGVVKNLSALDFSGVTNLNGVASVINAALTGASIAWNGSNFVVTSGTSGAGSKATGTIVVDANPSYGVRSTNTIELTGQPDPGDTVTIQGTVVTFVAGTPGAFQVEIGSDAAETADNLLAFLQVSADVNLALMTYSKIGNIVTLTARIYSDDGDAYTLTKVGTNISVGGATFSGGADPETLTVNGVDFTFVPSTPGAFQIQVGTTPAATAANIAAVLSASTDPDVDDATYSVSGATVTVEYAVIGTGGNAFTLATDSGDITVPATLTGGTVGSTVTYATTGAGTSIAALLKLTSALSQGLVAGYDAETPVECAAALANKSAAFYGLMFQASVQPTDDQNMDVAEFIEALDLKRIFGVTITNTNVLSAIVTSDLASRLMDAAYKQSFCQYSQNAYAIASFFGRAFSVNFLANRSTITLMFKQEPGVVGEDLSETQALALKNKRCNVFVDYVNDTVIIQYGVMSGPAYFDEIHGLDWLQNAIQTGCFNVLYQSKTKIPQTDAGVNQLVNAVAAACDSGVNNGLVAPGVWNADGFGELETGDYLKAGYYIFAQPIALQSQSDRETRAAPPIQVAVKLAGAIQSLDVIVDVNR